MYEKIADYFTSSGLVYIEFYLTAFSPPRVLELEKSTEELSEFQLRRVYVGCKLQ